MLSTHESHEALPWMLIYIILILLVAIEATLLPIYYWLPLATMMVIAIIIGYIKSKLTKQKMLVAMFPKLKIMILLAIQIYNGIPASILSVRFKEK